MLCYDLIETEYGGGKARDSVFSHWSSCLLQAAKQAFDLMNMSLSWVESGGSRHHVVSPLSDWKLLSLENFQPALTLFVSLIQVPAPTVIHIGSFLYRRLVGVSPSKRPCILDTSNHL